MSEAQEPAQSRAARRHRFRGLLRLLLLTGVTVLLAFWTKSLLPEPDPVTDHSKPAGQLPDALAALADESGSETQRLLAASNVARFGNEAVPELRKLLKSESGSKRRLAIMTLGQIYAAAEPALDDLLEMVDWNDVDQSEALVNALVRIARDDERVLDVLRKAAMADVDQICRPAFEHLAMDAYSKNSLVIELLAADDPSTQVRAIKALPAVRKAPDANPRDPLVVRHVATILERFLEHDSDEVRIAAFHWLRSQGFLTDAIRLAVLNGPSSELYHYCIRQPGPNRSPETEAMRARWLDLLSDETLDVEVRDTAMRALSLDGFVDEAALPLSVRLIFEEGLTHYDSFWPSTVWELSGLWGDASEMPLNSQIERFQQTASPRPALLLSRQRLSADDADRLAAFTHLKVLAFNQCQLEGGFLQRLSPLVNLRVLVIQHSELTDDAMLNLPAFPALTHLSLRRTSVSERIVPLIKRQASLTHLDVMDTTFPQEVDALPAELRELKSVLTRQPR